MEIEIKLVDLKTIYVDGTTVKESVKDACNDISNYKMVSDNNSRNKLFYASYVAGQKDATG